MKPMTLGLGACALALLAPAAKPQGAGDFVPSDALVTVHIPNLGQTIDHMRDAVETVCAHPALNQALQEGLEEMASEIGFNPLQKNTWRAMGIDTKRDAAFFLDMPDNGDMEPLFAIILPVSDQDKLQQMITSLMGRNRKMEWREAEGIEGAMRPWVESWDGESMRAEEMILAFRNGYAVMCGSDGDEYVLKAAELALGANGGLSGDANFAAGRQSLGERDVFANVRINRLMNALRHSMAAEAEEWRQKAAEAGEDGEWMLDIAESMENQQTQFQWISDLLEGFGDQIVLGLAADETGVRLGTWMKGANLATAAQPRAAHPALDALIQPGAMALLRYSVNPNLLEEMFLGMPGEMRDEMDLDEAEAGLEMVNGMLGVDLIEDIWRQWSGRIQISMGAPDEAMNQMIADAIMEGDMDEQTMMGLVAQADVTLALEFVDASGASSLVEQGLALLGESAPVLVETEELGNGGTLWTIGPDMGNEPMQLGAVAIVHNTLVAGTARGVQSALERVASQAKPQIANADVSKALTQPSATAMYIDLKPAHKLVKTLSEQIQQQELAIAEGVLMTLDSISLWSMTRGEIGRGEFTISFR